MTRATITALGSRCVSLTLLPPSFLERKKKERNEEEEESNGHADTPPPLLIASQQYIPSRPRRTHQRRHPRNVGRRGPGRSAKRRRLAQLLSVRFVPVSSSNLKKKNFKTKTRTLSRFCSYLGPLDSPANVSDNILEAINRPTSETVGAIVRLRYPHSLPLPHLSCFFFF
jgi:hypothetical protein